MKVLRNIDVLKKAINNITNLGFIPTMGGLHEGHISLIKASKKKCNKTLVSIYVNPTQFNSKKDFLSYPRNLDRDLILLKKLKIDFLFLPTTNEIYNKKKLNRIKLTNSQKILCAKFRKGHFEGVLNIMHRLVKLIKPKFIFMGEKDFQQLYLVKKFIESKYKSKIYPCKTIRNKNNLPFSSRNYLLSKKNLRKAGSISTFLKKIRITLKNNRFINDHLKIIKKDLTNKFKIKIEYLEFRNKNNFIKIKNKNENRLFIAYYINNVRLIDNF